MSILIVDDDDEVREIIAASLGELGYGVNQASSAEEALPLLRIEPDIAVMITDVQMPGMSGLELMEQARRENDALKVIVMSGYYHDQGTGVRPAARFLRKPFLMADLARAVRAELD